MNFRVCVDMRMASQLYFKSLLDAAPGFHTNSVIELGTATRELTLLANKTLYSWVAH